MDISKKDWELFKERSVLWQDRYMEKLLNEYAEIIRSNRKASERFHQLQKRIAEDRQLNGVSMEISRNLVEYNLVMLLLEWVITVDDLEGFSDALVSSVRRRARK